MKSKGGTAMDPAPSAPSDSLDPQQAQRMYAVAEQTRRLRGGANNYYWIAGLSVINSLIMVFNGGMTFVIGLGVTQIVDAIAYLLAEDMPSSAWTFKLVGLAISLAVSAVFAVFGFFAGKGQRWAFIVGMVLYGLDAILVLVFADYFGFGFHLLMLWGLFGGLRAVSELAKLIPQTASDGAFPRDIG